MKKAICAIGVLTISTAYAQNIKNDTITQREIEGVVIVASRKPQKISDIPGTVWVIPKTEIRRQLQSGVPIKEMLSQYIPGIDVGSQGRTNFGQNMRGRSVLLMIDGVTINSLRGVSRELESIDPFNIEKIEVLSGASSIYGGNATGGIINIITKKPEKSGFSGETQLSYLSGFNAKDDKDYRFSQSIAAKGEKMFGRFGVAFQQNGGFYNVQGNQILSDVTQTDLQYNRTVDVLFTGGYKINKQHEITGAIQFFDSRFTGDRSLYLGENYASLLKANPDLFSMQDGFSSDKKIGTTRFMGNVAYRATDVLGGQDAFIQISQREEKLGFYPFPAPIKLDGKSAVLNSASEQNTQLSALKVVLSKKWKSFDLTYGLDVDVEQFEAFRNVFDMKKSLASGGLDNQTSFTLGRYPSFESKTYAGYVQGKYDILSVLQLSAGLRHQDMNLEVQDFIGTMEQVQMAYGVGKTATSIPGGKNSYGVSLFNAGILYKPNLNQQYWFTFSQGAALADPAKFYGVGKYNLNTKTLNWDLLSSVNINDQKVQAIVTNQFELGYRFSSGGFRMQMAGFYAQSEKSIELDNSANNLTILVKEIPLRNLGIEGIASYQLENGISFGINALVIKSEIKNKEAWEKQNIFIASPSKVTSYFAYQKNKFDARFQNLQLFNLRDQQNNLIKGYNLSDLMLGYQLPVGRLNVGIQNLFNTYYQTVWSARAQILYGGAVKLPEMFFYSGRGRTFTLSYALDF